MTLCAAENIIFDLDGTISDPKDGIIKRVLLVLENYGAPTPSQEELNRYIGPPLLQSFESILGKDRAVEALALYRKMYKETGGVFENILYPDMPRIIRKLCENGKKLFVATSKGQKIAEGILEHFNLSQYFRATYGSSPNYEIANKPEIIALLLKQQNIAPEKAVMIGDTKYDMMGAKENGVSAVGVLWGYGPREELLASGADALAENPKDLIEILLP